MSILYGFPVTEARRRVPLFYKLQTMQEPPAEVSRRQREAAAEALKASANGTRRARRFQGTMPQGRVLPYPRLKDLGL